MTRLTKLANCVGKSIMKKRISTGLVEPISLNTAAKCGGAVVSVARINLVASSRSTKAKMTTMTLKKIKTQTQPTSNM